MDEMSARYSGHQVTDSGPPSGAAPGGPVPSGAPIVERVAGWSVRHRKIVVIGWLLLIVAAFAVGQHLGTSNTNSYDPGQAGRAERILNEPAVQQPDAESVLIQGRSAAQTFANDLELRQTVRQVVAALERLPAAAADIQSPFTSAGLVNGRSALVTFNVAGNPSSDDTAVVPALNAVAAIQARHPGLTVAEAGGASARPGGQRPDRPGLQDGRGHLAPGHAGAAADRVRRADRGRHPAAAGGHRGDRRDLAAVDPQPHRAHRRHHVGDRAAGGDGGRDRLLAVLPAPGPRGARGGPRHQGGAAHRGRHLGPGHRGVGADRDDLPRRAVPDRDRRVLRGGDRHHRCRRRGRARLADVPARAAVAARHGDRPRQDPVPGTAPGRRPPVPALGSGRPRGGAQAARVRRARGGGAAGAGDAAALAAPGEP